MIVNEMIIPGSAIGKNLITYSTTTVRNTESTFKVFVFFTLHGNKATVSKTVDKPKYFSQPDNSYANSIQPKSLYAKLHTAIRNLN